MTPGIRSSLAVVSTMVCRADWSIGLRADARCLVHDNVTPVRRATAGTLSLVFILDGIIFQSWLLRDARSPHQENNGKERYEGSCSSGGRHDSSLCCKRSKGSL